MDDKVLEEIRLHQDVVSKDASSPLYQIREKEMEISGRVLEAHGEADKLLADGRRQAAEIMARAETDAEDAARARTTELLARAEEQAAQMRAGIDGQVAELSERLERHHDEAVDRVVGLVTTV